MTLWTGARQAPLSLGFPRQEYWSGSSFPSPGDLSNPRNPHLLSLLYWQADSLSLSHQEARTNQYSLGNSAVSLCVSPGLCLCPGLSSLVLWPVTANLVTFLGRSVPSQFWEAVERCLRPPPPPSPVLCSAQQPRISSKAVQHSKRGLPSLIFYVLRTILLDCLMSIALGIHVKFYLFSFFGDFWVRE